MIPFGAAPVHTERTFQRFTPGQRWEHGLLILTFVVLLLTGLPQKFRETSWSRYLLATPERVELVRTIHRTAAVIFLLEAAYHVDRRVHLALALECLFDDLARSHQPAAQARVRARN